MNSTTSVKKDYYGNPIFPGYPNYGQPINGWDAWSGLPFVPGNIASLDYATLFNGDQFTFGSTNDTSSIILHGRVAKSTQIQIYDNGVLIRTIDTGRTGRWSANLEDLLSPGEHSVTVKITGASFPHSAPLVFTIDNSTLEIEPEIFTPDNLGYNLIGGVALTNDSTPSLAGKGQPNSQVVIYDEKHNIVAITKTNDYGNWKADVAVEQSNGEHYFTVEVGGKTSNTVVFDVQVPEPEPAFKFGGAFDDVNYQIIGEHTFTQDKRPTFEGNGKPGETIYFYDGEQPVGSAVTNAWGSWSFTPEQDFANGAHSISIVGGDGRAELHFIVEETTIIAEPVEISNLVDGNTFNLIEQFSKITDNTPWISGKSEAFANVSLYEGNKLLAQFAAGPDGKWFYEITDALENGTHTLTASVGDQVSDPFTFTVNAPQSHSGGGYRGIKSFSFSAAEVLAEEETPLFINDVEEQPATAQTLALVQEQLSVNSDASGLAIGSTTYAAELNEEYSVYQH